MNCNFCGKYVADGQRYCPNCGAEVKQPQGAPQQNYQQQQSYQQPNYQQQGYQQQSYQPNYQQPNYQNYQQPNYNQGYQQPNYGAAAPANDAIRDDSSLIDVYKHIIKNYANFNGRARRREFWLFMLDNAIINAILYVLGSIFTTVGISSGSSAAFAFASVFTALVYVYGIFVLVPTLALTWRRLHDIGRSGGYYFMGFIPLAGPIILLVYECTDSVPGPNMYGGNPKGR